MPTVHILQSESSGRYYVGCTRCVERRLAEHQNGHTVSTRGRGPWRVVYEEQFVISSLARRRERQIKSWKSRRLIEDLIAGANVV